MDILNVTTMNKNHVEIAKEKLQVHKNKGSESDLSIFQVAELIDLINGKIQNLSISKTMLFAQFGLN